MVASTAVRCRLEKVAGRVMGTRTGVALTCFIFTRTVLQFVDVLLCLFVGHADLRRFDRAGQDGFRGP